MKAKLLFVLLAVLTGWVYAQTWTRHLAWEDLVPAWEDHPVAEAYNVIPAIGGGYLMQGVLTIHEYDDYYINVFWKVSNGGEVLWRQDFYAPEDRISCLVSNGVDRYYALSPHYHRNILYEYDAQMNPVRSITIDSLFTNGEQIELFTMIGVDGGMVLGGRNRSNPFIMKLDNNLEPVWSHTFNGLNSIAFWDIKQTLDGGLICSGGDDLLRLNSQGDSLWVYSVAPHVSYLGDIVCNADHSYIVRGYSINQPSVFNFDDNGTYLGGYPYTLPGASGRYGRYFIVSTDQQLVILGANFSGYSIDWEEYGMLHKVSPLGNVIWSNIFLQHPNHYDVGRGRNPIFIDDQGYFILCVDPMIIIRADENGNAVSNNDPANDAPETISVKAYPNPAMEKINFVLSNISKSNDLSLAVYNLRGQILHKIEIDQNAKLQAWNLPPELGTGVYLYRLIDGDSVIKSGKFTIVR